MEEDNAWKPKLSSVWSKRPHNGEKALHVVRVNDYWPELCQYTIPNLRYYAEKIGAKFVEITERKYPDFPPTYEKLQVHELGMENEWNILIDADFLIHPMMPDITVVLPPDTVGIDYGYHASTYLDTSDKYFLRDGRNRGIATGFVVTNNLCHDLWTPLEHSWDEAQQCLKRKHIVDEFCIGRNLARFGLKYVGAFQEQPEERKRWLVHLGAEEKTEEERQEIVKTAERMVREWGQI